MGLGMNGEVGDEGLVRLAAEDAAAPGVKMG